MARVSAPLSISEQDRVALEQMISCGDNQLETRARIVLACSKALQNKDIAVELNVAVGSVAKWKEAYRKQGIKGLQPIHAGGRPSKVGPDNLSQLMHEYMENHSECTVSEIAVAFQISEDKVRYELRKSGINLQRTRRWSYLSEEQMSKWDPPVLGIYWSYSGGVILTATRPQIMVEGNILVGCMETRSSAFIAELEKSVIPVTLIGQIATASDFVNETSSGNSLNVTEFITTTIDNWREDTETEYHMFSFGTNPIYRGERFGSFRIHQYDNAKNMMDSFLHWMGGLASGAQHLQAENLIKELSAYHQVVSRETSPFVWYLKEVNAEDTAVHLASEVSTGMLPVEGKTWTGIEQVLYELLPNQTEKQTGTQVGALLYQEHDGQLVYSHVTSKQNFMSWNEYDYSSKKGFEHSLSRLESQTLLFAEEIAHVNNELYLNTVKKNKN